ncbi:hypothetical protein KCU85_g218, partial [Aureobasidium melanogenum]
MGKEAEKISRAALSSGFIFAFLVRDFGDSIALDGGLGGGFDSGLDLCRVQRQSLLLACSYSCVNRRVPDQPFFVGNVKEGAVVDSSIMRHTSSENLRIPGINMAALVLVHSIFSRSQGRQCRGVVTTQCDKSRHGVVTRIAASKPPCCPIPSEYLKYILPVVYTPSSIRNGNVVLLRAALIKTVNIREIGEYVHHGRLISCYRWECYVPARSEKWYKNDTWKDNMRCPYLSLAWRPLGASADSVVTLLRAASFRRAVSDSLVSLDFVSFSSSLSPRLKGSFSSDSGLGAIEVKGCHLADLEAAPLGDGWRWFFRSIASTSSTGPDCGGGTLALKRSGLERGRLREDEARGWASPKLEGCEVVVQNAVVQIVAIIDRRMGPELAISPKDASFGPSKIDD